MQIQDSIKNKLKKYNQEHIINFFENLDDIKKDELEKQIMSINFDEIINLYKNTKIKKDILASKISPIEFIDKEKLSEEESNKYKAIGENIIKSNQYAIITMAGRTRNKIRV